MRLPFTFSLFRIQKFRRTKSVLCRNQGVHNSEAVLSSKSADLNFSMRPAFLIWPCRLIILFLFIGCSSLQVNTDFDPTADFSTIHTYGWKRVKVQGDALAENPLLYKRIAAAVDEYLNKRGYQKTHAEAADVLVVLRGAVKEKMRITDPGNYGDNIPGSWYRPWRGYHRRRDIITYYTQGTLIIDIVDRDKKELIWRGLGTGIIHRYSDRQKEKQVIDTYVRDILDQFPPGNGNN